jgi:MATE family multidrug resistance protein
MVFGVPSMIMLVIEWVSFEVMGIYAGIIGVYSLGAHTILANVMTIFYMIPLGLSFATMAHIGNSLGKGEYKLAQRYFYISYVISGFTGLITVTGIVGFRKTIFPMYTQDPEILEVIYTTIPGMMPLVLFGNLHGNMKGIFKSIGKQVEAAAITSILYLVFGNTFSVLFGFKMGWDLTGIWIGFGLACTICTIIFTIRIFSMDWKELTRNTLSRISNDKKKVLV